jgi:hypothetical protein
MKVRMPVIIVATFLASSIVYGQVTSELAAEPETCSRIRHISDQLRDEIARKYNSPPVITRWYDRNLIRHTVIFNKSDWTPYSCVVRINLNGPVASVTCELSPVYTDGRIYWAHGSALSCSNGDGKFPR